MIPVYRFRRFHRILAVIIGIQILFWTLSGVYFAWSDLDEIHGDHLRAPSAPLILEPGWVSPSAILIAEEALLAGQELQSLELIQILGEPFYRYRFTNFASAETTLLVDVRSGNTRPDLDEAEAEAIARASFTPGTALKSVQRLEEGEVGPHHEYREGPLPAWRVEFEHRSGTRIYVAATEGTVITHRNGAWRIFDFLWMLHTMDYLGRDDINNPVLRVLSILALIVTLSGYLLWFKTRKRARRPS